MSAVATGYDRQYVSVSNEEVIGVTAVGLAVVLLLAWPRKSGPVRRRVNRQDGGAPEGPAHPYRRAHPRERTSRKPRPWIWRPPAD